MRHFKKEGKKPESVSRATVSKVPSSQQDITVSGPIPALWCLHKRYLKIGYKYCIYCWPVKMLKLLLQFWTCKIQKCLLISFFFLIFQRQRFGCLEILWHCNYVQLCLANVGVLWQEAQQELKTWNSHCSISSCEVRSRWQDILILPYPNKHQSFMSQLFCNNCSRSGSVSQTMQMKRKKVIWEELFGTTQCSEHVNVLWVKVGARSAPFHTDEPDPSVSDELHKMFQLTAFLCRTFGADGSFGRKNWFYQR